MLLGVLQLVTTTVIGTIPEFLINKSLSQLKSYTRFENSLLYPYIHIIPPTPAAGNV